MSVAWIDEAHVFDTIKVWWCDECGYWRQEKTSGVHVDANQDDPNGRMLTHGLREREFFSPRPSPDADQATSPE